MRKIMIVVIGLAGWISAANASVVLGKWDSTNGFPTSSDPPGYAFVTAYDEGGGFPLLIPPPPSSGFGPVFTFPISNDHPSAEISLDEISLTTTSNGGDSAFILTIVTVLDGVALSEIELKDDIRPEDGPFVTSFPSPFIPIDPIQPGELLVVYVQALDFGGGGGSGGVLNLTVTGTAVPEPSSLLLLAIGGLAIARRRR